MWNYNFMLPSLLMLAIIQCYYFALPRLPVRMNRAFQAIILSDCLVIFFDLVSSRADTNYTAHSPGMLYFLNMGFFVLFLIRIYCFYNFTAAVLKLYQKKTSTGAIASSLVFIISEIITLSSVFTGAVFSIGPNGYQRGPFYDILYVCFFFYIIYSVILLIIYRQRLSTDQFLSGLAAQGILFVGNIVRIMFPNYIVMNMFCFMAIFVLFLGFQNPSLYREPEINAYNLRGLYEILEEYRRYDSYSIFAFALKSYADERGLYGGKQMDKGVALICQYMAEHYPRLNLFYLLNGYFVVSGADQLDIESMKRDLAARFHLPWIANETNLYLRAGFIHLKIDKNMDTTDKIIDCFFAALSEASRPKLPEEEIIETSFIQKMDELTYVKRALENAITEQSVEIHLMTIVDSISGEPRYAEALARIRGSKGDIIPPGIFISLAERSGKINEIGIQVLEKVCRFINKYHPEEYGIQWINVNLSPVQFLNRNLCQQFMEILEKYDVDPDKVHLELTEQTMYEIHDMKAQTDMFINAGFRLSLDDYGQGYSNLTRLNSLPFADIKIDMQVVWDYCEKKDILLPSLIKTLKELGFSVTAEGIETEDMAVLMRGTGCDYMQGYLFSRPLPEEEFVEKYMTNR